jgi:hypothetical protein
VVLAARKESGVFQHIDASEERERERERERRFLTIDD